MGSNPTPSATQSAAASLVVTCAERGPGPSMWNGGIPDPSAARAWREPDVNQLTKGAKLFMPVYPESSVFRWQWALRARRCRVEISLGVDCGSSFR